MGNGLDWVLVLQTAVRFMVDLQRQELTGVQARDGYDAWELIVDAWGATDAAERRGVAAAVS
jgi:hypothetical protein